MIFAANWKMYKTPDESREFIRNLKLSPKQMSQVVIFPTAICIEAVATALKGTGAKWGVQNGYIESAGAFTGENSPATVKSLGGSFVLIGHSERRALFHEQDGLLAKKVKCAQNLGLTPMLCIGETLAEREAGQTLSVIDKQLKMDLEFFDSQKPLVIAYEPVWAIGTGKVATTGQVAEVHTDIRKKLVHYKAEKTPILYGGSVKPQNAKELGQLKDVDGFLIGGASLEVESFAQICATEK